MLTIQSKEDHPYLNDLIEEGYVIICLSSSRSNDMIVASINELNETDKFKIVRTQSNRSELEYLLIMSMQ